MSRPRLAKHALVHLEEAASELAYVQQLLTDQANDPAIPANLPAVIAAGPLDAVGRALRATRTAADGIELLWPVRPRRSRPASS